ncbi:MAG: auxin-regulated protein [Candidatus Dadabacteria bacterium]|nr:MAG: auxin-regulated protein [Candidatus Dadabacteria bacterium]
MINITPILRAYGALALRRYSKASCVAHQKRVLFSLLRRAAGTKFGKEHGFKSIHDVKAYQSRVPIRRYEEFWSEYWQKDFPVLDNITYWGTVPYFAVTSGTTTGKTKYIPYTKEMIRANNRAGLALLSSFALENPSSAIWGGKSFVLGGSTDLVREADGIYSGDLSGIVTKTIPRWCKGRYFPPEEIAFLSDWEKKIDHMAEASLKEDIRSLAGVPSWLLILFEKLREKTGKERLAEIYPRLELIIHGGVKFDPYRPVFERYLLGSNIKLREVYPASEGFIAFQDSAQKCGLRLIVNNCIFYEFVPLEEIDKENPTRHWIEDAEPGVNYALVMTTAAGLWSYVIGDTVRFIDNAKERIEITGRISYSLSAFGEHLIGEEIEEALTKAGEDLGFSLLEYSVGALFPSKGGELGRHVYILEVESKYKLDSEAVSQQIDSYLSKINDDYAAHRADGFGMASPKVVLVKRGTFAEWMKSRGKLGGQNKVPRIINDVNLLENLLNFIQTRGDKM